MNRLIRAGIILGVITAVEIGVFAHYNSILQGRAAVATTTSAKPVPQAVQYPGVSVANTKLLAASDDGTRLAYVDANNMLHVRDLGKSVDSYQLQLRLQPVYLSWIRSDSLFIGTEVDHGYSKDLRVSTIDVTSGTLRLIKDFTGLSPSAQIQKIAFSPYTNDVYILITGDHASLLYHFDTNGVLTMVSLGGRYITNVAVPATTGDLIFQDFALGTPNILAFSHGTTQLIQRDCVLLRVVKDTVVYGALDASGRITSVNKYQNGVSTLVTTLTNPVQPDHVFISGLEDVLVRGGSGYTNEGTGRSVAEATASTPILTENTLFFIAPSGTVTLVQ